MLIQSTLTCTQECVYINLYTILPPACIHHSSQDNEHFQHHQDLSFATLYLPPSPLHPPCPHLLFSEHINLSPISKLFHFGMLYK